MTSVDTAALTSAMRTAIRTSDVRLSKYNPLPRILALDDFNEGTNGWTELIGNFNGRGDLDTVDAHMRDFRPPQLSNATFFDTGTHGAMTGTYSLKLATRPHPGHTSTAIRRLTMAGRGRLQIEAYLTYKAEAQLGGEESDDEYGAVAWDGNLHPSEAQFGAFTVATDLCGDGGMRYHTVARFQNTDQDGNLVRRLSYPVVTEPTPKEHLEGKFALPYAADFTAPDPDDWRYLGDPIEMCFNEVPTKVNWHYLRWVIDTETRTNIEFQLNDRLIDMRDVPVPVYDEPYESLDNLLNFYFSVRTLSGVRNFLYLDSVVISADW